MLTDRPIQTCRYDPSLVPGAPGPISDLRIQQRASRAAGYLTRCQVATFVAAAANGRRRIDVRGARWRIGIFTCTYRYQPVRGRDEVRIQQRCVHTGRWASTVWFDTYA